ncbi:MAG: contractile injection system tape measure protein [Trichormus sp.]
MRPEKHLIIRDEKLQIEQQAIDILLSCLPWGESKVKLSWMEEILIVEWH